MQAEDTCRRLTRLFFRQAALCERGATQWLWTLLCFLLLQRLCLRLLGLPWRRLLRLGLRRFAGPQPTDTLRLRMRQLAERGAVDDPSCSMGMFIGQPSGPFLRGPFGGKSLEIFTLTGAPHTQLRSILMIASSASSLSVNVMNEYVSVSECLIVIS